MASSHKIKFAILVHQLPVYCRAEALALLPQAHIGKVEHDQVGLKIYFNEYNCARECILKKTIRIQKVQYTICPLATNLTLHDIRKWASISTVRNFMTSLGSIVDLYSVEVVTSEGNSKTRALTDDYRIILDVPEVHMVHFKLPPLVLSDFQDHSFRISFFCRLCRSNGHMQYQCSMFIPPLNQPSLNQHCPRRYTPFPEAGCSTTRPGCSDHQGSNKFGSKEKKSPRKENPPKRRLTLSRIIPPGTHHKTNKRLLRTVVKSKHAKITQKGEHELEKLLDWNRGRDQGKMDEEEKKFIKWLELYLVKVRRERKRGRVSKKERHLFQTVNTTGVLPSEDVDEKVSTKRKKAKSLSPGIEEIVFMTTGTLSPDMLRNFLNQVRGRKKALKIAAHFTTDFPSLFLQLEKVVKTYYIHGKRGTKEDGDISFIERLRKRLMQRHAAQDNAAIINEMSSFEALSSNDEGLSKTSVSKTITQLSFNTQNEDDTSVLTRLKETYENPTEFQKSALINHPISTTESCSMKSREEKLKQNLQRSLSSDVEYFKNSSSLTDFSTEEGPSRNFKTIRHRSLSVERPSRRIPDNRKSCSSVEDSPVKFETNFAFYGSTRPTNLCDTRRAIFDDDSIGNLYWDVQRDFSSRSSYTTQSSTDDSLEGFSSEFERTSFYGITIKEEPSDGRGKSRVHEEFSEISKEKLRQILSSVMQTSESISFERDRGTKH